MAGANSGPSWLHRIGSTVGGTEMFSQNFKQAGVYFFDVVATTEQAYVSVGISQATVAGQAMEVGNISLLLQP